MIPNVILIAVTIMALVLIGIGFIVFFTRRSEKGVEGHKNEESEIHQSSTPSIESMSEIPLSAEVLIDLATEVWRAEQKLTKINDFIPEIHKKDLDISMRGFKNYLQKYDVEVQDYTGQQYHEGLNVDILSHEQDSELEFPIIKETIEPGITCRGKIVKKAKVIVASHQL